MVEQATSFSLMVRTSSGGCFQSGGFLSLNDLSGCCTKSVLHGRCDSDAFPRRSRTHLRLHVLTSEQLVRHVPASSVIESVSS